MMLINIIDFWVNVPRSSGCRVYTLLIISFPFRHQHFDWNTYSLAFIRIGVFDAPGKPLGFTSEEMERTVG
jgi:hypothetical protein